MSERIKISVVVGGDNVITVKDRSPAGALSKLQHRYREKFAIREEKNGISG